MRHSIATRALPILLLLMAIAVLLILSGATGVGLAFGLVVAGMAGVVLVATVLHDLAQGEYRDRPRRSGPYRWPHARGY